MPISLQQFSINRIILHEVSRHVPHADKAEPVKGTELIKLTDEAKKAIEDRIVQVLGRDSQSIEVEVDDDSEASTFQSCVKLMDQGDADFVDYSFNLAQRLATAQASKSVPGGLVVVFDGTVGSPTKRFISILKAEKQAGFVRHAGQNGMALEYLKEIFLTEDTKLYKIGFIHEDEEDTDGGFRETSQFTVMIYDHLITRGNREAAAQYFYKVFLGCKFAKSSKSQTRKYYLETQKFVNDSALSQEDKLDLIQALYSYVKVNNEQIIDPAKFAVDHMPVDVQDAYSKHLRKVGLPPHAINKDLSALQTELKRRQIVMEGQVRLSAPAEAFQEKSVEVWTPEDEPDVTMIKVRGKITGQR